MLCTPDLPDRPAPPAQLPAPDLPDSDELRRFLCTVVPREWERKGIWTWGALMALRSGATIRPVGHVAHISGRELAALQQRTNQAFVCPVFRVSLAEPLLAFRFYGDLCRRVTLRYASLYTVARTPGFGEVPRTLLGLTGRNSASNLVAVRIETDSRLVIGGISNRAEWADQILVDEDARVTVLDNLARYALPA